MAHQKRKPKVKKARAAKKKAHVVRALKRHVPKARAPKKVARAKQPERGRKPALVAKVAPGKPLAGKPDDKAGKAPNAPIKSAKAALELLEAKDNEAKAKGKRGHGGRRGVQGAWRI